METGVRTCPHPYPILGLMTVLPKKVFPPPPLAWSVVSKLEEDPAGVFKCEIKCLGCTCLWFSFVFKQTNKKKGNILRCLFTVVFKYLLQVSKVDLNRWPYITKTFIF